MLNDSSVPVPLVLSELQAGDCATIIALHTVDEALRQRLLALGMRMGRTVSIMRQAPFGGPLQVRIGATDIIIRLSEANKISVQKT